MSYLWLPVRKDSDEKKLHIYANGEKIQELDVKLDPDDPDHFFAMDLGRNVGSDIEIRGDVSGDNGMLYGAVATEEDVLSKSILIEKGVKQICIYRPGDN